MTIVVDHSLDLNRTYIVGANQLDYHLDSVDLNRDVPHFKRCDLRLAVEGDVCGDNEEDVFKATRGIEVGHIFKLGTKYSDAMKAHVLSDNGRQIPVEMGCYGIGIGRTVAAAIEQSSSEKGLRLPKPLVPFEVMIIPVLDKDAELVEFANKLYTDLIQSGVDVLLDDRKERAGVKFNDADMIGVPTRVILGKGFLNEGKCEVVLSYGDEKVMIDKESILKFLTDNGSN